MMSHSPPPPPDEPSAGGDGPPKKKHGGARKMLTWQEKLALVDNNIIAAFIQRFQGSCKCKGIERIAALGQAGINMVLNLRDARMAGMCMSHLRGTNRHYLFSHWRSFNTLAISPPG